MRVQLYLTHAQKIGQKTRHILSEKEWNWEHRPLITTHLRKAFLPEASQYILSSATAIRFLEGKKLNPRARYFTIGPRTLEWAHEILPRAIHPALSSAETHDNGYSLLSLVSQLPAKKTVWLGSAQGLMRHGALWARCPWIKPVVTHWTWPSLKTASSLDWQKPAHITCHCQNAALVLGQLALPPTSIIWVSSARLIRFLNNHVHVREISQDWVVDIEKYEQEHSRYKN